MGAELNLPPIDYRVKIWQIATGTCLQTLRGHTAEVCGVHFSPDGQLLASASSDRTIRLWDVATGQWLPGQALVSIGIDQTIRFWDVSRPNPLDMPQSLGQTQEALPSAPSPGQTHISPDGSLLVSGRSDRTIRVWNVETGACLTVLRPDRLYEAMNIKGITGLSAGVIATLKSLGAVEL